MKQIIVTYINVDYVQNNLENILSTLDDARIKKANKYRLENDKLLSIGTGYLISKFIGKTEIISGKNGKLYAKNGYFFNVSHSGKYAAIAVSKDQEIGIDIQLIEKDNVKPIQYVSHESLPINEMFCLWSNKESLIKCLGGNMSLIKDAPGLPLIGKRTFLNENFYTSSLIFEGYSISVTLKGEEPFEIVLKEFK